MNTPTKSWLVEVQSGQSREWTRNQLRFATEREAQLYGTDLFTRWLAVKEWRTARSGDDPTDKMVNGVAVRIEENTHAKDK